MANSMLWQDAFFRPGQGLPGVVFLLFDFCEPIRQPGIYISGSNQGFLARLYSPLVSRSEYSPCGLFLGIGCVLGSVYILMYINGLVCLSTVFFVHSGQVAQYILGIIYQAETDTVFCLGMKG